VWKRTANRILSGLSIDEIRTFHPVRRRRPDVEGLEAPRSPAGRTGGSPERRAGRNSAASRADTVRYLSPAAEPDIRGTLPSTDEAGEG